MRRLMRSQTFRIGVAFAITAVLVFTPGVYASNIPPGPAACGDTVVRSFILRSNLTGCSGDGLIIGANGITLNCLGHSIEGSGPGIGIDLNLTHGDKIVDCTALNFAYGFFEYRSTSDVFTNDKVYDNSLNQYAEAGFYLNSASRNTLTDDIANNTVRGFSVINSSSDNHFKLDTGNNNSYQGFYVASSSGNQFLKDNASALDGYGFYFDNTARDTVQDSSANLDQIVGFYVGYTSSSRFQDDVANLEYANSGWLLFLSPHNVFTSNTADNDGYGFIVETSGSNVFNMNNASDNDLYGFYLDGPQTGSNVYEHNSADGNLENGFQIVTNSTLLFANKAIGNANAGFYLSFATEDILTANWAQGNVNYGYYLYGFWPTNSSANTLTKNTALGSSVGFYLDKYTSGNVLKANEVLSYGTLAYQDLSTGGPAGSPHYTTDNIYTPITHTHVDSNTCAPAGGSSPAGIC